MVASLARQGRGVGGAACTACRALCAPAPHRAPRRTSAALLSTMRTAPPPRASIYLRLALTLPQQQRQSGMR